MEMEAVTDHIRNGDDAYANMPSPTIAMPAVRQKEAVNVSVILHHELKELKKQQLVVTCPVCQYTGQTKAERRVGQQVM
jgi:hypothetical protein